MKLLVYVYFLLQTEAYMNYTVKQIHDDQQWDVHIHLKYDTLITAVKRRLISRHLYRV